MPVERYNVHFRLSYFGQRPLRRPCVYIATLYIYCNTNLSIILRNICVRSDTNDMYRFGRFSIHIDQICIDKLAYLLPIDQFLTILINFYPVVNKIWPPCLKFDHEQRHNAENH